MDEWTTTYLQTWKSDFGDEPDAEPSLRFLETVLSELIYLSQEGPLNAESAHKKVSHSITAVIMSLPDPSTGLEDIQGVLFEAAISSPLEPSSLANITRQFINDLPARLSEKLENGIAYNTRERWNGPDKPPDALEKMMPEYIQKWVSLNEFTAHLTRLHVSLGDYGIWTLDRALDPLAGRNYSEDERIYHIPAAAAWIDVLGAEIYRWSVRGDLPGDNKWEQWKNGFMAVSQSDGFLPDTREKAQMAFNTMREVEKAGTWA